MCEETAKASDVKAKNCGDPDIDDPKKPCPLADVNIVSVAWLNGDDETTVGDTEQYVNLPRAAKWVNGDEIKNIDRLGLKPRFKVKFDKKVAAKFKYKLVPVSGGTPAYTATEEGRNSNFVYTKNEKSGTTGSDGVANVSNQVELVAGGGFKFKLQATDEKGKTVESGVLTTKRLFWCVEVKMKTLTGIMPSTSDVEAEYASHHIKLKVLPALEIDRIENIDFREASQISAFRRAVEAAVDGSAPTKKWKPHLLTVAYTDMLASKKSNAELTQTAVQVGPGKPDQEIDVKAASRSPPNTVGTRRLWHNVVTGEGWLTSAKFIKDGGGETDVKAKVSKVGGGPHYTKIKVDVTGLPAGTGKLVVKVDVVDMMAGGLALGSGYHTCVCARSWWQAMAVDKQKNVAVHEIGHKVQMVVDGTGNKPDKVSTHYVNKGHNGPHCHEGAAAGLATYADKASVSTCTMFGAVNRKKAFCANCAPAVKKVDLGGGF